VAKPFLFQTPAQTQDWARRFAATLERGDVIALIGPLGAGKTTFVQGLAVGLFWHGEVTSPTFALVNEYGSRKNRLYHMDMYRLSEKELHSFPLEEYYETGICIIEWADRLQSRWPDETLELRLEKVKTGRRLRVIKPSARWKKRLKDLV